MHLVPERERRELAVDDRVGQVVATGRSICRSRRSSDCTPGRSSIQRRPASLDESDVQRLGKAFRRATGLLPTDFRAAARAEVER
ncbi:MAG: hypothetical protein KGY81_02025 [Phycisphaerae bacterium]|nr:hypothetical protein [Phycisphaerae bacterium]